MKTVLRATQELRSTLGRQLNGAKIFKDNCDWVKLNGHPTEQCTFDTLEQPTLESNPSLDTSDELILEVEDPTFYDDTAEEPEFYEPAP